MTTFRNLFIITGLAFLATLPLGILAIRLPSDFVSVYIYLAVSTLVSWLFLHFLRRTLRFQPPPRHGWFVVRGGLVDPLVCLAVAFPFVEYIVAFCMALHLARVAAFVLLARHYCDLRPFVRGESEDTPYSYHDGKPNAVDAVFFRSPPTWLGELLSAGSSLRRGDEIPPRRVLIALSGWIAILILLLSQAILFASATQHLPNLPFYLAIFIMLALPVIMLMLLIRRRICSYVGSNGAVEFRQRLDGSIETWEARFDDYTHLKKGTDVYYRGFAGYRGAYIEQCETRCFENSDGSVIFGYTCNWQDPTKIGTEGALPDVRMAFWHRIEAVWALRKNKEGVGVGDSTLTEP
ncbi:MAG: hypothetical protein PHN92_06675 [Geobacter sp.]|nr:hypothetical protein [Geobacter sp.]